MLIYASLCKYNRQTDGQTDKHIKSIVRNLTIKLKNPITTNFYFDLQGLV